MGLMGYELLDFWVIGSLFVYICVGSFREDLVLIWFGMVWLSMIRFGLRQHPSEASVKVSSRSDLFWLFYRRFSVGLALYG